MTNIHLTTYMSDFPYRTIVLILPKKVTSNLPKFPQQKSGQTQQQFPNFSKISTHKLHNQFSTEKYYIPIRSQMHRKYLGKG